MKLSNPVKEILFLPLEYKHDLNLEIQLNIQLHNDIRRKIFDDLCARLYIRLSKLHNYRVK
jgi:hypothetical protein